MKACAAVKACGRGHQFFGFFFLFVFYFIKKFFRLTLLENKIKSPGTVASVDSLLDIVTALVADCDHDFFKGVKNIEAYTSRCKYYCFMLIYYAQVK